MQNRLAGLSAFSLKKRNQIGTGRITVAWAELSAPAMNTL